MGSPGCFVPSKQTICFFFSLGERKKMLTLHRGMRRQWPREGVSLSLRLYLPVTRGQTQYRPVLRTISGSCWTSIEGREGDLAGPWLRDRQCSRYRLEEVCKHICEVRPTYAGLSFWSQLLAQWQSMFEYQSMGLQGLGSACRPGHVLACLRQGL